MTDLSAITAARAVVLFSKNWAGKLQAGRFPAAEAERAAAAASKNGASMVVFSDGDDADLLAALPAGKFGEKDRPVLSNVKVDVFKRLAALAELKAKTDTASPSPAAAADGDGKAEAAKAPSRKKAAAMRATTADTATGAELVSVVVKEGGKHWPALKKGDVVLATDFSDGAYNGWWEAVVIARSDSHVTLEWRDYKDLPTFTRPITQVAPIHPECIVAA